MTKRKLEELERQGELSDYKLFQTTAYFLLGRWFNNVDEDENGYRGFFI